MLIVLNNEGRFISILTQPTEKDRTRKDVLELEDPGFNLTTEYCYINQAWVKLPEQQDLWPSIRERRDRLLKETDWTQLSDVVLPTKEAWAVYRQQLRDITNQPDPTRIVWPVKPS